MTTDFLYCLSINEWYSSEETERKAKKDAKVVYLAMGKKQQKGIWLYKEKTREEFRDP